MFISFEITNTNITNFEITNTNITEMSSFQTEPTFTFGYVSFDSILIKYHYNCHIQYDVTLELSFKGRF